MSLENIGNMTAALDVKPKSLFKFYKSFILPVSDKKRHFTRSACNIEI